MLLKFAGLSPMLPRVHDGSRRTVHPICLPTGSCRFLSKELTVMNMWGLAIVIGAIVIVTVIMGLIATHGSNARRGH